MYPVDDSKTCSIYNSSFLNDLKPYIIKDTLYDSRVASAENPANQCVLEYIDFYQKTTKTFTCESLIVGAPPVCRDEDEKEVNTQGEFLDENGKKINEFSKVNIRISEMKSIVDAQNSSLNNCWLPAFVKNDNNIDTKEILAGSVVGTKLFGIENFISVDAPKFQNWDILNDDDTISATGVSLSSDWIINSNLSYLEPEYGILFWYKKNITDNADTKEYKLSFFE